MRVLLCAKLGGHSGYGQRNFSGLIEDKFIPIIGAKVEAFDCRV